MNRLVTFLSIVFLSITISTCNVFSPVDVSVNHLDKCKGLSDAGDYEGAVAECTAADPDGIDPETQLELGDANLSALGIGIKELSDIFLQASQGTVTIVQLAESIIAAGKITGENYVESKAHAAAAITAFDNYGALLGNSAESRQVAAFYSTLVRTCFVAIMMAYADITTGDNNGQVTKEEICTACTTGTLCVGGKVNCGGMNDTDAADSAQTLIELNYDLTNTHLGSLQSAIEAFGGTQVWDPDAGAYKLIESMPTSYKADSGRDILWQMAR